VIRTLVADDEEPARVRLRRLLTSHADVVIVGEAESGVQTMELADHLKPDLILLDIQMPGCTGLDVAASLRAPRPLIVFCTAYDEHAVDAFELAAVDYLLKPVSRARLAQALDRVRTSAPDQGEIVLDHAVRQQPARTARFLVRTGESYLVVHESRVLYFASEGGITRLVTDATSYSMDPTLNELERRLSPSRFFRVSRSALISLNAVAEVHPLPGGSGEAMLKNGERLEVTRRRLRELLESLEHGA
jgi:two-component system LytT family response regulator